MNYWDGTSASPNLSESMAVEGLSTQVEVRIRRVGKQIVIIANDSKIARLDDVDLFPEDRVYLGANVMPNSNLIIHKLGLETAPGQAENVEIVDLTASYTPSASPLRSLAQARGLTIGAAVAPGPLRGEQAYADALDHEFSILTPENAMKFGPSSLARPVQLYGCGCHRGICPGPQHARAWAHPGVASTDAILD